MEAKATDDGANTAERSATVGKASSRKRSRSTSQSLERRAPSQRRRKKLDASSVGKSDTAMEQPKKRDNRKGTGKHSRHKGRRANQSRQHENKRKAPPRRQKGVNVVIATELSASVSVKQQQTLQWQTIHPHVSIQSEETMLKTLIRWKKKERGMMKNAGDRYKTVMIKCKQVGMDLSQALSLRRQYMHHLNPRLGMKALGLGRDEDIRKSAALFESAVQRYLKQCQVKFWTEHEQKARHKGTKTPPTPDFMLKQPTLLSTVTPLGSNKKPRIQNFVIHWVEAKMFYGASCIANESQSAVGSILSKSESYVELYGTGAMVFMYGCGKEMAEWLLQRGVVALDAHPLDLQRVEEHQRTWCAANNESGLILP